MASEYLKWKYRDVRPDKPVELTPAQRRANWWDYHKWHVAGGAALLLTAVYLAARALGVGGVTPDYQVAYVGPSALPADTAAALEGALAALGEDCDGDGRVVVRLNQYIMGEDAATTGGMYAAAGSTQLMADLEARDSYFFLLEDPEAFQESYEVLRPLDGGWEEGPFSLPWASCPVLAGLDLGEYRDTLLGQEVTGDSQALLSRLSLARRGFWTEKTAPYAPQCDALWEAITKEALP